MENRFKQQGLFKANYRDFEAMVKERWGHEYSYVADEEMRNDTSRAYLVAKGDALFDGDKELLGKFEETGKYQFLAETLLQVLCNEGVIESGEYIIEVSW